jgi:ribosomal protein S18 acetylase RimI-like enzyme
VNSAAVIRRATAHDAAGIVAVLEAITAERVYSAIDKVWSVDGEARYISGLSSREAIHVATDRDGRIVGIQTLDRWSPLLESMAHVGQLGTFILPEWRRHGLGRRLWETTLTFARTAKYRKLVIYVRGSNGNAQAFYRSLGFEVCGRLMKQVMIDGVEDDEVLMEFLLRSA